MPVTLVHARLLPCLRAVSHHLGEFIHVSAIYLGLAVLTTLGLSLALPSVRQQSQQLHQAVLTMFQADGRSFYPVDDAMIDWYMGPDPAASSGDAGQPAGAAQGQAQAGSADDDDSLKEARQADFQGFVQALQASMRDEPVDGLTKAQDHALRSYLSRKYKVAPTVAGALIRTVFSVGGELGVDPQLILAVIAIESRYNPFVESTVGAQGLMQVMTRVHRDKLKPHGGRMGVFNPVANIWVGTRILADCIKRRGSVRGGLACYVGATGPGDRGYGASVLAEMRRIALASGLAPRS